jgi:hypothetical protein
MASKKSAVQQAVAEVQKHVLDNTTTAAITAVFDAERAARSAEDSRQKIAKDSAAILWASWTPKPANGKAMDAKVASIAKGAEADGLRAQYAENIWNAGWQHLRNYLYLCMLPNVTILSDRKSDKGTKIDVTAAGTNAMLVKNLAAEARRIAGTGRKREAAAPTPAPVVSAQALSAHVADTFEVNTKSVLLLIEKVLSMPSGVGLIQDALKAHGWIVVAGKEKQAELDAANAALQLKRKSAELAEQAKTALLARAAKRTGKAKAK